MSLPELKVIELEERQAPATDEDKRIEARKRHFAERVVAEACARVGGVA